MPDIRTKIARILGGRIRELRHERHWGQVDLEAHLDGEIMRSTISCFETGKHLPSLESVQRLADAFETEPASLFLSPNQNLRHRVALAVLECSDETLRHVAKLVDVQ